MVGLCAVAILTDLAAREFGCMDTSSSDWKDLRNVIFAVLATVASVLLALGFVALVVVALPEGDVLQPFWCVFYCVIFSSFSVVSALFIYVTMYPPKTSDDESVVALSCADNGHRILIKLVLPITALCVSLVINVGSLFTLVATYGMQWAARMDVHTTDDRQ
jgi:hypothetical protein